MRDKWIPRAEVSSPVMSEQARQLRAHSRRDIVALECVGDVGGKETHLRAAIEAATRRLITWRGHRVRSLAP